MPSKSRQQQKFMGIVRSIQKGDAPAGKFSKAAQKAAKSMKKSSVRKYAKTKHDDLPKKVKEERDYKDEYKKFQSSPKMKKYRAELNKYNRKKGTYGNGDGKDASHKGGKIVGFESQSKNRGRAEKSRLKKEGKLNENPAAIAAAQRMVVQSKSGKVSVNTARQSSYAKKDPSTHKKAKSMWQRIKDKFSKKENMSEKVNPEMKKIYKLLLKYGNSERDAAKMIKKNYDYVAKTYKGTTPRNKAVVLVGLQAMGESINEAFAIQYKKDKRYLTRKELFDKKPLKFKTEDEAKSMLNGLDHKYRTNYKIVKIKEGTCGYGVGGKLGEEPAGPHLMKKKKKLIKSKVEENKDPDIISQLRGVLKKGYSSVKDPVSGKKMKVDTYTASAITKVYDAINTSNKKKFSKLPLLKMQSIAMKFVK